MIYSVLVNSPRSNHAGRSVFFAAKTQADAVLATQRLGVVLNSAVPTLISGPRMCCKTTGEMLGWRDAQAGADSFDPLLLSDPDYRAGYRWARVQEVGEHGLTPREQHETLIF